MVFKLTLWDQLISVVSTTQGVITRQYLIKELELDKKHCAPMDTYRNYLHQAGYLHTVGTGTYQLKKPIPENFTVKRCVVEAYATKGET